MENLINRIKSKENIELSKIMVAAMAWEETVKSIVIPYQKKILADNEWYNERELNLKNVTIEKKRILNPNEYYLLSDKDAQIYYKLCDLEAKKAGLKHKVGCCPLLEAESFTRSARNHFAEAMLKVMPGYENIKLHNLHSYKHGEDGKIIMGNNGKFLTYMDSFIELSLNFFIEELKELQNEQNNN